MSAYSQTYRLFDFNPTPIAPLGIKLVVHEKPEHRESWNRHAIDGWYIGSVLRYYRCFRVWATVTNSKHIVDTIIWFSEDYFIPRARLSDSATIVVYELTQTLLRPHLSSLDTLCPKSMPICLLILKLRDNLTSILPQLHHLELSSSHMRSLDLVNCGILIR